MVKHTQTIRQQQPTNCLSVLDHFVGLALKGLNFLIKSSSSSQMLDLVQFPLSYQDICLGHCHKYVMELFAKMVNA